MTLSSLLHQVTHRALLRALRLSHGSRRDAAHALGLPPRTLQRLLATHVTRAELTALSLRHGWPTRAELAANARAARCSG